MFVYFHIDGYQQDESFLNQIMSIFVCSGGVQFEQGWQHLQGTKWREDWDIDRWLGRRESNDLDLFPYMQGICHQVCVLFRFQKSAHIHLCTLSVISGVLISFLV